MGDYVNVVLENDGKYESYKFADGEATGVSAKGTKSNNRPNGQVHKLLY